MMKKEDTPVAVWIGHHPAGLMGAQSKLGYPVSHYPTWPGHLAKTCGWSPRRPSGKTVGSGGCGDCGEGYIPCGVYEAEGLREYTGYVGPQIPAPVIEVTCVTYRRNAIYQDYAWVCRTCSSLIIWPSRRGSITA